jgi:alkylhydroperoxidase/carboxymuconolactone decarboxylase family protein YurZ
MTDLDARLGGFAAGAPAESDRVDGVYVDAYRRMAQVAGRRNALSPAMRELVGLAVNSGVTHLYAEGIQRHVEAALAAGASRRQILETLQLASVLGVHSITIGLPIVLEVCGVDQTAPLTPEQERLKSEFIARRGGWTDLWNSLLHVDEEYFVAYTDFSSAPWENEPELTPKEREFVYVAIDASTTHLLVPGIKTHAENAVRYGATVDELVEVLELCSLVGVQTYTEGARTLFRDDAVRGADD